MKMSTTIYKKLRILPFMNSFYPVLFSSAKQTNKLVSQYQNSRHFCKVLMDLEKKKIYIRCCKYCERKPRILRSDLTERISKFASLHHLSKPPENEKNTSVPKEKKRSKRKKRKMADIAKDSRNLEWRMRGQPRQSPNYFLAIQITEEEIKQNVKTIQDVVVEREERLSHAMIHVDTLHLTLGVYYLEDGWSVLQITRALDKFHEKLRVADFIPPSLTISSLGHFGHKVLFASVEKDQGLEDLNTLVCDVRKFLKEVGVFPTDDKYTPHITISKMSKNMGLLRRLGVRRIEPAHYEEKTSMHFGKQIVKGIQLCSMEKPKTLSGYYHVEHEIKFSL